MLRWCDGLNERGPHRLMCLNVELLVGGGVQLGLGFEVSKDHTRPSLACFLSHSPGAMLACLLLPCSWQ